MMSTARNDELGHGSSSTTLTMTLLSTILEDTRAQATASCFTI